MSHTKDVVYVNRNNEFTNDKPENIVIHYNGDYSGDVQFVMMDARVEDRPELGKIWDNPVVSVYIPFEVIRDLVADWVRANLIRNLEQMPERDVLLGRHHEAR
jgi:hypothetical protein